MLCATKQRLVQRHLPREHVIPFPTYGGIQVQVKLLRLESSSHMAFSSHGILATPVQSSIDAVEHWNVNFMYRHKKMLYLGKLSICIFLCTNEQTQTNEANLYSPPSTHSLCCSL